MIGLKSLPNKYTLSPVKFMNMIVPRSEIEEGISSEKNAWRRYVLSDIFMIISTIDSMS